MGEQTELKPPAPARVGGVMTALLHAFRANRACETKLAPRRLLRWGGLLAEIGPPPLLARDAFFVSSARRDAKLVRAVLNEGRAAGHAFWIGRARGEPGQPGVGAAAVVQAIVASIGMLVFCSPAAYGSEHVLRQVTAAARFKKPILPVILEGGRRPAAFLDCLSGHQAVDVSADPAWRIHFLEALDGLREGRSRLS